MYYVKKEVLKILAPLILLLTQQPLCIQPLRPLIVLRISFKDKKAYIKRRICFFLVKRAIVAYGREVGALG
jgi:hypothetical protein